MNRCHNDFYKLISLITESIEKRTGLVITTNEITDDCAEIVASTTREIELGMVRLVGLNGFGVKIGKRNGVFSWNQFISQFTSDLVKTFC